MSTKINTPPIPFPILETLHGVNKIEPKRDEKELRKFQDATTSLEDVMFWLKMKWGKHVEEKKWLMIVGNAIKS